MSNIPLEERKNFVGGSEVAALFNESPWFTKYDLWMVKMGLTSAEDFIQKMPERERLLFWGNQLESGIAQGVANRNGFKIRKVKKYLTHPKIHGMGASLDFKAFHPACGWVPNEIKNVDKDAWLHRWKDGHKVPYHIYLQCQHQMAVTGKSLNYLSILVGGNDEKLIIIERSDKVVEMIENEVRAFWESVHNHIKPEITELPKLQHFNQVDKDKILDLSEDEELEHKINVFLALQEEYKVWQKIKTEADILKAQILERVGDAAQVTVNDKVINCDFSKGSEGTRITPDMVGDTINKRAPHRKFNVKFLKKKGESK